MVSEVFKYTRNGILIFYIAIIIKNTAIIQFINLILHSIK